MDRLATLAMLALWPLAALAQPADYVDLPGGAFRSTLRHEENGGNVVVPAFSLMKRPVGNGEFRAFVRRNPQWHGGGVPALFADRGYLAHWREGAGDRPEADARQPVVGVSWFAADAYCREQDARLPTWTEWEYAAAADETRPDARRDAAWRARVLSSGTGGTIRSVASGTANLYGLHDLHGLVWEWTDDHAALLSARDDRAAGSGERLQFCGATALTLNDRDHYAVVKRIALLSALQARDTLPNLGFRCARSLP